MYRLANAVTDAAFVRRRLARGRQAREHERFERVVADYAPGRSFVDVGGMFSIHGQVAFRAEEAGASRVTLFDGGEPTPEFLAKHKAANSKVRTVQGDLEDPASVALIGEHDFVYCAGVLYHTPNPFVQLTHLRSITREYLLLATATIPEIPGVPHATVYYPFLDAQARAPWAQGWQDPAGAIGIGTAFDERAMYGHGNCWWGYTPSALRALVRSARFEIVDEFHHVNYPWGMALLAKPVAAPPSMPPTDYYRLRGEQLAAGHTIPFDGYYDKGSDAVATIEDAWPDPVGLPALDVSPPLVQRTIARLGKLFR